LEEFDIVTQHVWLIFLNGPLRASSAIHQRVDRQGLQIRLALASSLSRSGARKSPRMQSAHRSPQDRQIINHAIQDEGCKAQHYKSIA
jgi:PIN domain nuclease of toxin-antitoxin system